MTNWKELIGKRCLVKQNTFSRHNSLVEVTVLEVSPSGERVKLQLRLDFSTWFNASDYKLVEVLEDCSKRITNLFTLKDLV